MLWHRNRNARPMLVWTRQLFKQVVTEYTGQASGALAHSPVQTNEHDKAEKSGQGDTEKEGETRLSA